MTFKTFLISTLVLLGSNPVGAEVTVETPSETPGIFVIPAASLAPSPTPSASPSPDSEKILAIQVRCAAPCQLRDPTGKCQSHGTEACGQGYACAARCMQRSSDGKCMGYTTDFCGPGAICQPRCASPGSDGKCTSYLSDACVLQSVGPSLN